MIDAVEEFLDVQINHPVLLPAASPARPHRIQRGPLRPVTIGVGMEFWFHSFLQLHGYHCLRDSVRDGRHAEDPHPRPAISVSPPPAPGAGSSSPRTSDSISGRDCSPDPPRSLRPSTRPRPALPDWL